MACHALNVQAGDYTRFSLVGSRDQAERQVVFCSNMAVTISGAMLVSQRGSNRSAGDHAQPDHQTRQAGRPGHQIGSCLRSTP